MKQFYFLLFFIVGLSAIEYHGDRKHWNIVDADGKTVALHLLNEKVDLIFPSDKNFHDIASDMKLYSPIGNVKCQDTTNTLKFMLLFDEHSHIRGEIKMALNVDGQKVNMYLYQKCGVTEFPGVYAAGIIEGAEKPLESDGRSCFLHADPFQKYDSDATRSSMKLHVTPGNFGCQVFLILPNYMHVKDVDLKEPTKLSLNATYTTFISADPSPISFVLVYDGNQHVYVNVNSPLPITAFPAFAHDTYFAADQFVIQVEHVEKTVDCKEAEIWIYKSDFINGTEVLVDKSRFISGIATTTSTMESGNTIIIEYSTTASSTKKDDEGESAGFQWWYIPVVLLIVGVVAVVVAFICIRRRRRNKIPERKIRHVSQSAESQEIPAQKSKSVQKEKSIAYENLRNAYRQRNLD
uniref:Uncharacterized protein n=1 Tax=Panagrolaimus davidi TaxID=227884 RepID=A0A914QHR5_9BILA